MLSLIERLANATSPFHAALKEHGASLRVAIPGIVQSFDEDAQTVTVQPAINEAMLDENNVPISETLPLLSHVPIVMPRAGGFELTLPVQAGDECLVVFSDMCIDGWWQSGGTQNQIELRRHDLSDAIAILGPWSQQRLISGYSTSAAQLRSDDGQTVIEVGSGEVKITANTVTVTGQQINVTGSESVSISGNNQTTIDGVNFKEHTHSGVTAGGGVTGPVVP